MIPVDKYIYILVQNERLDIGGGSSTEARVRVFSTRQKAEAIRNRHFPKAMVVPYERSDIMGES